MTLVTPAEAALVKARLNLYAVLPNLEELVRHDPEAAALARKWNTSVQFSVRDGPAAFVEFAGGACRFGRGTHPKPKIKLGFKSPDHLNLMFDDKARPQIRKGFTRLWFLGRSFPRLTKRLAHFLKPSAERRQDSAWLELNTRLMLNTAAMAIPELAAADPVGKIVAPQVRSGTVLFQVLPDGPCVHIRAAAGVISAAKGPCEAPSACVLMRDAACANSFLRGATDAFTAVALGEVLIKGHIPMIDALGLILDRVPKYLE